MEEGADKVKDAWDDTKKEVKEDYNKAKKEVKKQLD